MTLTINLTKEEVYNLLDFIDEAGELLAEDYLNSTFDYRKCHGYMGKINVAKKVKQQIMNGE